MVKMLPVDWNGKNFKIKLIVAANKIKFSMLFPLKNLKFFKIKITSNNAIVNVIKRPTIPVSVKISK